MQKRIISSVELDPPHTRSSSRTRYRVTLACGCWWWEDYDASDGRPSIGAPATCHNPGHGGDDSPQTLARTGVSASSSVAKSREAGPS